MKEREPLATIQELKKSIYHRPLPRKKQRILAKKEYNSPVKIFTEEERFIYTMRKIGKEIGLQ